jgi:hypothetical protein
LLLNSSRTKPMDCLQRLARAATVMSPKRLRGRRQQDDGRKQPNESHPSKAVCRPAAKFAR